MNHQILLATNPKTGKLLVFLLQHQGPAGESTCVKSYEVESLDNYTTALENWLIKGELP